ncbi:hypothetical protein Drorol1_Dr00000864 [Drosera rotundifolia]
MLGTTVQTLRTKAAREKFGTTTRLYGRKESTARSRFDLLWLSMADVRSGGDRRSELSFDGAGLGCGVQRRQPAEKKGEGNGVGVARFPWQRLGLTRAGRRSLAADCLWRPATDESQSPTAGSE